MRITALHSYPVKGCHRLDHDEAGVAPWGLTGDRRWMVIDPDGVGITQRKVPRLALLHVSGTPGGLLLTAPGQPPLTVEEPTDGEPVTVRVFSNKPPVPARLASAAGTWCTDFLGVPARLAWQADPTGRVVQHRARPTDRVSLADGYPILIANPASLAAVNDWLVEAGEQPVPMTRFRPNVVVGGAVAWAEDKWVGNRLMLGDVPVRVAKACDRCVVTTIDQETGVRGSQPLKILGQNRRFPDGLLFGVNVIPDLEPGRTPVLRVGDVVSELP